jgi:adenylate cyclase class 2
MHQRLHALGAKPKPKVFEINTCYDTPQHHIVTNHGVLRLRQDDACHLTLKRRPAIEDPDVKVYEELEVLVSDFKTMEKILANLGYHPACRYEKWRQSYILGDTLLCMDTLPFGNFLEIEGDKGSIRQTAGHLDLKWENRILTSYLAIFDLLRKEARLSFDNPTFEHFKGLDVTVEPYLNYFEAGP